MEDMPLSGPDNTKLEVSEYTEFVSSCVSSVFMCCLQFVFVFRWSHCLSCCRPWSMTSTLSWWKMPVWACVLRYIVPWNKAISSWMKRTKRAWRSLVGAMASSLFFPVYLLVFLWCVCLRYLFVFFITLTEIVDQPGVDIFGQVYNQWKNKECECPNCKRLIAASRFAPHLEKCLGMGRNSSRIANRRSVDKGHSGPTVVLIQNDYKRLIAFFFIVFLYL